MAKKNQTSPSKPSSSLAPRTSPAPQARSKPRKDDSPLVFDPEKVRSCRGSASYAYLSRADVFRNGDPTHKITVTFDPTDPEYTAMVDRILAFENSFRRDNNSAAVNIPSCIKADKENGRPCITFRTKAKEDASQKEGFVPVMTVGPDAKPIDPQIWSGDTVRVVFTLAGWTSAIGCGVKPYLNAVQLLVKAPRQNGTAAALQMFEDESDGGTVSNDTLPDEAESGDSSQGLFA